MQKTTILDKNIQKMFARISRRYDLLNHLMSFGRDRSWRRRATAFLPNRKKLRVLDLCAGTGEMAIECMTRDERSRLVLVDFSPEILRIAERKVARKCEDRAAEFVVGDALKLPFDDRSFDAVVCAFGVRNIEPPALFLLEVSRVLKNGGKLIVIEFFKPDSFLTKLVHYTYVSIVVPLLGAIVAWSFSSYRYLVRSIRKNLKLDEFCLLAEVSGFRKTEGTSFGAGTVSIFVGEK